MPQNSSLDTFNWANYLPPAPSLGGAVAPLPSLDPLPLIQAAGESAPKAPAVGINEAFKPIQVPTEWADKLAKEELRKAEEAATKVPTPAPATSPTTPMGTSSPTTPALPASTSRLGAFINDPPLDAIAKLNLQYTAGPMYENDPNMLGSVSRSLVPPLAQVLANGGAGSEAILENVARMAWYRQGQGKFGVPEAAPREYIQQWKDAYRRGQAVPLSQELNAQLTQNGVDLASMYQKLAPTPSVAPVQPTLTQPPTNDHMYRPGSGPTVLSDGVDRGGDEPITRTPYRNEVVAATNFQPDSSSPDAFMASVAPYAAQVERETGVPAKILMGIAANETGYGKFSAGNNYFGIKGSNPRTGANTGMVDTWEDYGNGRVNIQDTFRAYDNPAESFRDFVQFLQDNSRYANALTVRSDPVAFIRAIHRAGYATDPEWSDKVLSIGNRYASRLV